MNTTDNQLKKYLCSLDPSQKRLGEELMELPPNECFRNKNLTQVQLWHCEKVKNDCWWIAARLIYLLVKRIGQRMPDPLARPDIPDSFKKYIDTSSDLLLAEFDLIIEGWEIIESTALEERGYFPFNHPTELFGNVLRCRSISNIEDVLVDETICEVTLKQIRQNLREESSFFRDNLTPEKEQRKLATYKNSEDWDYFVIYSIWKFKNNNNNQYKKLVKAWKQFLKAHKTFVAMFCNQDFFKDENVIIDTYTFTGSGRVFIRENRRMLEGKVVNGELEYS